MKKLLTIVLTVMMVFNTFTANVFALEGVETPNGEEQTALVGEGGGDDKPQSSGVVESPNGEEQTASVSEDDGVDKSQSSNEVNSNAINEIGNETSQGEEPLQVNALGESNDAISVIDLGDQLIGGYTNAYIVEQLGVSVSLGTGRGDYRIRIDNKISITDESAYKNTELSPGSHTYVLQKNNKQYTYSSDKWEDVPDSAPVSFVAGNYYGNLICDDDDVSSIKIDGVAVENAKGTHKVYVGQNVIISCEPKAHMNYKIYTPYKSADDGDYKIEPWGDSSIYYKNLTVQAEYTYRGDYEFAECENGVISASRNNPYKFTVTPDGGYYVKSITVAKTENGEIVSSTTEDTNLNRSKAAATTSNSYNIADLGNIDNSRYVVSAEILPFVVENPGNKYQIIWNDETISSSTDVAKYKERIFSAIFNTTESKISKDDVTITYETESSYYKWCDLNNQKTSYDRHVFGSNRNKETVRVVYAGNSTYAGFTRTYEINLVSPWIYAHINIADTVENYDQITTFGSIDGSTVTYEITPNERFYVDNVKVIVEGTEDPVDITGPTWRIENDIKGICTITFVANSETIYKIVPEIKSEYELKSNLDVNYVANCGMDLDDDLIINSVLSNAIDKDFGSYEVTYLAYEKTSLLDVVDDQWRGLEYPGNTEQFDYLGFVKRDLHAFGVETDKVTSRDSETVRIKFTSSNNKFTDFNVEEEINLVDGRKESKIYPNSRLIFVQYANAESIREAIARNVTVYEIGENGSYEVVPVTGQDIAIEPETLDAKYLTPQNIKVIFKGNKDVKPSFNEEIKVYVAHLYSDIDINTTSKRFDGNPADITVTAKPAGINYMYVTAGIEGDVSGYISINYDKNNSKSLVEDKVIVNHRLFKDTTRYDLIKLALSGGEALSNIFNFDFPELTDVSDYFSISEDGKEIYFDYSPIIETVLPSAIKSDIEYVAMKAFVPGIVNFLGTDAEYLNTIISVADAVKLATANIDASKYNVVINQNPIDAGIYTIVAATLQKNYNTAIDVKLFTIFAQTNEQKLVWRNPLPNVLGIIPYKFNEEGKLAFEFGVKDNDIISNNKIASGVTNELLTVIYTGLTSEGKAYFDSVAPTEPGAYSETFILTGNAADMITRSFILQRVATKIDLTDIEITYGDELPEIGLIKDAKDEIVYDEEGNASHAVILYVGKTIDGKSYSSYVRPTNAGEYQMIATYSGTTEYQPTLSITKTLTIKPREISVSWNNGSEDIESPAKYNYGADVDIDYTLNNVVEGDTKDSISVSNFYSADDLTKAIDKPSDVGYYYYEVTINDVNYTFADGNKKEGIVFHIYDDEASTKLDTGVNLKEVIDCDFDQSAIQSIIDEVEEDDDVLSAMLVLSIEECSSENIQNVVNKDGLKSPVYFDLTMTLVKEKVDGSIEKCPITSLDDNLNIKIKLTDEQTDVIGKPRKGVYKYYLLREHIDDLGTNYEYISNVDYKEVNENTEESNPVYVIEFANADFSSFAFARKTIPNRKYVSPMTGVNH